MKRKQETTTPTTSSRRRIGRELIDLSKVVAGTNGGDLRLSAVAPPDLVNDPAARS